MRNKKLIKRLAALALAGVLAAGSAVPTMADTPAAASEAALPDPNNAEASADYQLENGIPSDESVSDSDLAAFQSGLDTLAEANKAQFSDGLVGSSGVFGEYPYVEIYRLYNPNAKSGSHFYTENINETANLVLAGWNYEGIMGFGVAYDNATLKIFGNRLPIIFRLYNPNTGEHLYGKADEAVHLQKLGWKMEEASWYGVAKGMSWKLPTSGAKTKVVPVYRLYNPNAKGGDHFYTTNAGEKKSLIRKGWRYDGIVYYALHKV